MVKLHIIIGRFFACFIIGDITSSHKPCRTFKLVYAADYVGTVFTVGPSDRQ